MTWIKEYQKEIADYLSSKLKTYNVPKYVVMEIVQYCVTNTILVVSNEIQKAYQQYKRQVRRVRQYENKAN